MTLQEYINILESIKKDNGDLEVIEYITYDYGKGIEESEKVPSKKPELITDNNGKKYVAVVFKLFEA